MEERLSKKAISDMAVVCKSVDSVGGRFIYQRGSHAAYQRRGIYLEFCLDEFMQHENFLCCRSTHPEENASLKSLTVGQGITSTSDGKITFKCDDDSSGYFFSNGYKDIILKRKNEDIILDSIDGFMETAQEVGPMVKINKKGEVSLTGKEKIVCLAIRDETFTGIRNNGREHFFNKKTRASMEEHALLILESEHFIKVGREKFEMRVYLAGNKYWLLTEANLGKGIHCRMLERLIVL